MTPSTRGHLRPQVSAWIQTPTWGSSQHASVPSTLWDQCFGFLRSPGTRLRLSSFEKAGDLQDPPAGPHSVPRDWTSWPASQWHPVLPTMSLRPPRQQDPESHLTGNCPWAGAACGGPRLSGELRRTHGTLGPPPGTAAEPQPPHVTRWWPCPPDSCSAPRKRICSATPSQKPRLRSSSSCPCLPGARLPVSRKVENYGGKSIWGFL
ncbi:uncharacterized protein LOC106559350 isoform X2 [Canis lupus familiaris]|uniref:uncharacterized protein LOC106559350 isoform X2 n=1 Tax=Canis lupus familiaris TaxID=9615 RepID=UPI0018F55D6E|nr:uncharacterized protein LOC106559350 isoform X2 [Canis lupus familiaris]